MRRILVVDDMPMIVTFMRRALEAHGFEVSTAGGGEEAIRILDAGGIDVVVSDIKMAPVTGLQVLEHVYKKELKVPVVLMTAFGTIESASTALKYEAFDYLTKPLRLDQLIAVCVRSMAYRRALEGVVDVSGIVGGYQKIGNFVVSCPQMDVVCRKIMQLVAIDEPVLIVGERGAGKSAVARAMHDVGSRAKKPFATVDCAKMPKRAKEIQELFVGATGGTIFFENIETMDPQARAELALVLSRSGEDSEKTSKEMPRIVSSSCVDAGALETRCGFGHALLIELADAIIEVPSLRERRLDILPLVWHLFRMGRGQENVDAEVEVRACDAFESYEWPGNVDELADIVRAVIARGSSNRITEEDLPAGMRLPAGDVSERDQGKLKADFMHSESLKQFIKMRGKDESARLLEAVKNAQLTTRKPASG